jgi:hypothetical protein
MDSSENQKYRKQWVVCGCSWGERQMTKWHENTIFLGDERNVHFAGDYMTRCICQNSHWTFKMSNFYNM